MNPVLCANGALLHLQFSVDGSLVFFSFIGGILALAFLDCCTDWVHQWPQDLVMAWVIPAAPSDSNWGCAQRCCFSGRVGMLVCLLCPWCEGLPGLWECLDKSYWWLGFVRMSLCNPQTPIRPRSLVCTWKCFSSTSAHIPSWTEPSAPSRLGVTAIPLHWLDDHVHVMSLILCDRWLCPSPAAARQRLLSLRRPSIGQNQVFDGLWNIISCQCCFDALEWDGSIVVG